MADRVGVGSEARVVMDGAIDRAEQVLVDGRDQIVEMRARPNVIDGLSSALVRIFEDMATLSPMSFRVSVDGEERRLDGMVAEECYRVAREALFNAARHAGGSAVNVRLCFDSAEFKMTIVDDGVGIPPDTLSAGSKPGHWGLSGIRERALRMGGWLEIVSAGAGGTAITLAVPADLAYEAWRVTSERGRKTVLCEQQQMVTSE